jgi:hypothetical protein
VDSQQVTIGTDHYFGPISDNHVGSINVTQSGFVCLLYGMDHSFLSDIVVLMRGRWI